MAKSHGISSVNCLIAEVKVPDLVTTVPADVI